MTNTNRRQDNVCKIFLERVGVPILAFLACAVTGCRSEAPSLAEQDPPVNRLNPEADFYGMLRRTHYSYIPHRNESELAGKSETIVVGRPAGIDQGRTFGSPANGDGHHTFVMKFLVEKVIKGEADKIIYVEFMRSRPTEIDELRTRMPSDRMRLYLIDYDRHPPFKGEKFDDRAGLPDPATRRFGLTGVQGMMVQTSDGIVQPLADRIHWITDGVTL